MAGYHQPHQPTWDEKISALQMLYRKVGRLWTGTALSGYSEHGPYFCGHCKYLTGADSCKHPIVIADSQTKKNSAGLAIVNAARGCCEFVEPGD